MTNRRRAIRASAVVVALAATAATASTFSTAWADSNGNVSPAGIQTVDKTTVDHDLEGPFSKQQEQERKAALEQVLNGEAKVENRGGSKVVKLDSKKYVELGREKTDKIFTILVEFGDKVDNTTLVDREDDDTTELKPKYGGEPGPLHNAIA
ncbi:immune inhibitor A domain-containing protein, partial [Streptomyces sp. NPDC055721]